jgi:hypothetical protein
MTPEQARRRAARRVRRRRRKVVTRALLVLALMLGGAVLTADVVEVSKDPALMAASEPPRGLRAGTQPSRPRVPVPVFHPSILLDALEVAIPELDARDLELVDPALKSSLARRRFAQAEKQRAAMEKRELLEESESERVPADLIQVSAVEPHLLEIVPPRPFVDPSAVVVIPELFPPPNPDWPIGWPGVGWIDFPTNPGGSVKLLRPLPGAREREDDDDEKPPIIPEPGTATLLAFGLVLLGIARLGPSRGLAG